MMTIKKFHRVRRVTGAFLFTVLVGLPFITVNGSSAFRFDVPTLRLLFFGTEIWIADFFIILIAVIFLTFLILYLTTVFGRLWCGWLCPQTVLVDASEFMKAALKRLPGSRISAAAALLVLSAVTAAGIIGYFVAPYDLPGYIRGEKTGGTIIIGSGTTLTVLIYLNVLFVGRNFCATACPYAKLQNIIFDDRTLLVGFDRTRAEECMECSACVNGCPVGIDIRKGAQIACIHCAECVDACTERMARRGRTSLIRYFFGMPGTLKKGLRINPLITGAITALSFLFLIYLAATRMPFDITVRLNYTGAVQRQTEGGVMNQYEISFRNVTSHELLLELDAAASSGTARIVPQTVRIPKGSDITRIPVFIALKDIGNDQKNTRIILTARSPLHNKSISRDIFFTLPNK